MDIGFFALVFVLGAGSSFLGSLTSGGLGIISLAALFSLGLSPHVALGTFRVGTIGFTLGGLPQYIKAKKVAWNLLLPLTIAGTLGSVIGAQIAINTDEELLKQIIGFAILLFIPLSIFKPTLGIEDRVTTLKNRWLGHIAFFFVSIWGGSVTVGTGILAVYSQMYFYGLSLLVAKGTNRIPNLIKSTFALAVFAWSGLVAWDIGLVFALGMVLGAYIGTKFAIKIGDVWLRKMLLVTIALISLSLVLGF